MPRETVPQLFVRLARELAAPSPMRRGSMSERFMKCGRKECRCQHDPQARHGPYFSLTSSEGGEDALRHTDARRQGFSKRSLSLTQRQVILMATEPSSFVFHRSFAG